MLCSSVITAWWCITLKTKLWPASRNKLNELLLCAHLGWSLMLVCSPLPLPPLHVKGRCSVQFLQATKRWGRGGSQLLMHITNCNLWCHVWMGPFFSADCSYHHTTELWSCNCNSWVVCQRSSHSDEVQNILHVEYECFCTQMKDAIKPTAFSLHKSKLLLLLSHFDPFKQEIVYLTTLVRLNTHSLERTVPRTIL